jgi:hypothetical protein
MKSIVVGQSHAAAYDERVRREVTQAIESKQALVSNDGRSERERAMAANEKEHRW